MREVYFALALIFTFGFFGTSDSEIQGYAAFAATVMWTAFVLVQKEINRGN